MATKKITDLNELTSAASGDVLPIVDISEDITKKITTANMPISTATQTALDGKQDTLVSGTNIKTINSTSLLGSGDISIEANPSGGAGLIQFSDGSAFASDSNLYWDNTNKRLGVGTNTPGSNLEIKSNGTTSSTNTMYLENGDSTSFTIRDDGRLFFISRGAFKLNMQYIDTYTAGRWIFQNNDANNSRHVINGENRSIGVNTIAPTANLHVKGSGSTSATTALLVQNSSGSNALQVRDDRVIIIEGMPTSSTGLPSGSLYSDSGTIKIV